MSQKLFNLTTCSNRAAIHGAVLPPIAKRYLDRHKHKSAFRSSAVLAVLASEYSTWQNQVYRLIDRASRIAATEFIFNFNRFSDKEALLNFRFRLSDICKLVPILGWPSSKPHTSRNTYAVTPILATCLVLRRMAVPDRWEDICTLFGKHPSQLSEIFWEAMDHLISTNGHLLLSPIPSSYMEERAAIFSKAIKYRGASLPNCVGFIDGTVVGVVRPKGYMRQLVVYNGHKRKHALKYQAVNTPDGMILLAHGAIEGRRHDWFLYSCSGLETNLESVLIFGGIQYVVYGNSGYSWRVFMEVPFQGSNLNVHQKAFNTSMSKVRVTVEWIFKEVKMYFPICDTKRKMKICESPVGLLYLGTMLMCNFHNCCYPNQISQYFGVTQPSLEEYFNSRGDGAS